MKPSRGVLIVALALGLLAAPLPSDAQQPGKVYRIGYLAVSASGHETNPQRCPIMGTPLWQAWVEGLRERGYVPGQNLVIECRWTGGREERAASLAAELVSLKVDLLVANGTTQVRAAKQATSTLPIVMVYVADPVESRLVASLARPGGNLTGVSYTAGPEIAGKHLELLKEAIPKLSRVAVLGYSSGMPEPLFGREREAAAQALGVTLQVLWPPGFRGDRGRLCRDDQGTGGGALRGSAPLLGPQRTTTGHRPGRPEPPASNVLQQGLCHRRGTHGI